MSSDGPYAAVDQEVGVIFSALERTDRCCRLIVRELRESHPSILETPEFERLVKLSRRQFRENRELLGIGSAADKAGEGE